MFFANAGTKTGLTTLHAAVEGNSAGCTLAAVRGGADLELRKYSGSKQTALQIAAGRGHADCLRVLVDFGADVTAQVKPNPGPVDMCSLCMRA